MVRHRVLPLLLLATCCMAQAYADHEFESSHQRVARGTKNYESVSRLILDTMTKLYENGASTTKLGEALLKFIYLLKGAELGHMKETEMPTEPGGPAIETTAEPENGTNSNGTESEDLTNSTNPDSNLMPTPMLGDSATMMLETSTVVVMATNSMEALDISPSATMVEMSSSENVITPPSMENSNSTDGSMNVTEAPSTGVTEPNTGVTEPLGATVEPIVEAETTTASSVGENGEWGPWSSCSGSCGACGTRKRLRDCSVTGCSNNEQIQKCGLHPCPSRLIASKHYCYKPVECPGVKYPGNYPSKGGYPSHPHAGEPSYADQMYSRKPNSYGYPVARKRRTAYDRSFPGQRSSPRQVGTYNINIQAGSTYQGRPERGFAVGENVFKDASGKCSAYTLCETKYESGPYCCPGHKIRGAWCMTDQYYQWYSRYYAHYKQ